jgi:hypothetical protein
MFPDNAFYSSAKKYLKGFSESIFVSISSYKDSQFEKTIEDLFLKAKNPEKIYVGVCLQDTRQKYENCKFRNHPNVKIYFIEFDKSISVCFARSIIQRELLENEKYYLQIDSHTRFLNGWDEQLIQQIHSCNHAKAILSCYPNMHILDNKDKEHANDTILPHRTSKASDSFRNQLQFSNLIHSSFVFTYSSWCKEVAYPKNIRSNNEENYLFIQSFLKGYEIFCPNKMILNICFEPLKNYCKNLTNEEIDAEKNTNKELLDIINSMTDEQNDKFKKKYTRMLLDSHTIKF